MNFQGTNDGTLSADFQKGGAGYAVFQAQERDILLQIANYIKSVSAKHPGKKIDLDISGHSLGAAYTQNAHAAILKAMANTKSFKQLGLPENIQREFEKRGYVPYFIRLRLLLGSVSSGETKVGSNTLQVILMREIISL